MREFDADKVDALRRLGVQIDVYAPRTTRTVPDGSVLSPEVVVEEVESPLVNILNELDDDGVVAEEIDDPIFGNTFFASLSVDPLDADVSGWHVVVGLPYRASVETMPLLGEEGRRSHLPSADFILARHENFCVGRVDSWKDMRYGRYFYESLTDTSQTRPLQRHATYRHVPLPSGWDEAGSMFVEAQIGQPLEILQIVLNETSGDALRDNKISSRR